jgi:CheY-like chemotaxis protein
MSRLDGIAAARAIRSARVASTRRPFVLGLSAHAGLEYETDALAAGMDCFMTKPIGLRHLASILNPVLGTNPSEPSAPVDPTQERASAALFGRLRAQYQAEAPALIRELRAAFVVHDWKELKQRVHYMKNCADVIGALPLQQSCRALFEWADQPENPLEGARLLTLVELSSIQPFSAVSAVS